MEVSSSKTAEHNTQMLNVISSTSAELVGETHVAEIIRIHRIPRITLHAFYKTPDVAGMLSRATADRRMSHTTAKLHSGGILAAIDLYRNASSPNLVIVEHQESPVADFYAQLDALADVCTSGTKVIVIGPTNDVGLYRELLRRRVSEYLVAPIDPLSMMAAISRLYQDPQTKKFGSSLAFVGANGGVGSSTIAQNVASAIARTYECDVIIADLDLAFGTVSLGFDLKPNHGIAQALKDSSRFDDLLLERLLTKCEDHLQVLIAPAKLSETYDFDESAFERVLEVAQSTVPFMVLDVPHTWTAWVRKTLMTADEVLITAVPDLAGLRNAKSLIDLLKQARPNDAPPKLVLNQIGVPKRAEIAADKFATALQIEPIACVPFDAGTFSAAANNGKMIADVSSRSAVSKSIAKIARTVVARELSTNDTAWPTWTQLLRRMARSVS